MPEPERWLIGQPADRLPEPVFLHVFDDGEDAAEMEWRPDRATALRFGSAAAARRFAAEHRLGDVAVTAHAAAELAMPPQHPFDRAAVA